MSMYGCRPHRATLGHKFERTSGWCIYGCGVRDDGRVTSYSGQVLATGDTPFDFTEPRRTA